MILLTALPRTGKSTAIKKIVEMLGIKNCGGFYTEEIRENGERVGFKIVTLSGKSGILSHVNFTESKYKISKYGVDLPSFENLCLSELKEAIERKDIKYIIIDEIGPMQLFSEDYKKLLLELLKSDKKIIGTIFMNPYEWLDDFKKQEQVELIEITLENRDTLPLDLVERLTTDDEKMVRKVAKAKRYSKEPFRFVLSNNSIIVTSEHGIRTIKVEDGNYKYDCEFFAERGTCSHILAAINLNLEKPSNEEVKEMIKR